MSSYVSKHPLNAAQLSKMRILSTELWRMKCRQAPLHLYYVYIQSRIRTIPIIGPRGRMPYVLDSACDVCLSKRHTSLVPSLSENDLAKRGCHRTCHAQLRIAIPYTVLSWAWIERKHLMCGWKIYPGQNIRLVYFVRDTRYSHRSRVQC